MVDVSQLEEWYCLFGLSLSKEGLANVCHNLNLLCGLIVEHICLDCEIIVRMVLKYGTDIPMEAGMLTGFGTTLDAD